MKKIIIAIVLIVAIGGFAYWNSTKMSAAPVTTTTDTSNPTSAPSETTNPAAGGTNTTSSGSSGSTGTTASSGSYKDGSYTGVVADAFYGNLQVQAIISGGKIVDVVFLQQPNTPQESVQVNSKSSPILKSEAIAAQSAKVDVVSGATQSSEAFQQSLASALSQAQV